MKIENTLKYANETVLHEFCVLKKANQWIAGSKLRPVPKMLFGEFWMEGELAVLAAGPGMGKSLLGVQIAESIARSRPVEPLQMTAPPQKVLYIDLKLSEKQFEMRYAAEYDDENGEFLTHHYKFSDKFERIEIDIHKPLPDGFSSFDELLPRLVEGLVLKTQAKVVIIDSITHVQRSAYGYRETHFVMKELDRMKRELGISILVLARSGAHDSFRGAAGGPGLLARFADSVFTIGQSKQADATRYLKHITAHSTGLVYDSSHVASFRIARIDGNFLGLVHQQFAPESVHLADARDRTDWPLIQEIKDMTDEGMSVREIAAELKMPKTTVHRMLQMWTPQAQAAKPKPYDPTTHPDYFPGKEEYQEALNDEQFKTMFSSEDEEDYDLRRKYCKIERAMHEAGVEYKRIGIALKLPEMLESLAAAESKRTAETGGPPANFDDPNTVRNGEAKRPLDDNGREMFIEKVDENGKPQTWTVIASTGLRYRFSRQGQNTHVTRASD